MRQAIRFRTTISGTQRRALEALRALGASTLLTMRLFDILPQPDTRPRAAIVREFTVTETFDPRELLPNGMVLTLPLSAADQRPRRFAEIGPN